MNQGYELNDCVAGYRRIELFGIVEREYKWHQNGYIDAAYGSRTGYSTAVAMILFAIILLPVLISMRLTREKA
ncbi:hypothetical protein SDC9_180824 [bioreactor metagenome]|uniref:Uncharacterized protein n=1 Tax=bioreactor metagenome TaxID=1076179 RepID=A0A645H2T4_9ZZZZ